MALLVSSVPLSLTIELGLPRSASSRSPQARDRGIGYERQAFARTVVDHRQDAQPPAIAELIGGKIERPAIVRQLRDEHRRSCPQGAFASAAAAHGQPLFAIEP